MIILFFTSIVFYQYIHFYFENEYISNASFATNKKYTEIDFIDGIINIIRNNTYWCRYNGKIKGTYLNKKHNEYCKLGVYECLYEVLINMYYRVSG